MNILYITAKRRFDLVIGNYLRNYAQVFFVTSDPLDDLFFSINGEKPIKSWREAIKLASRKPFASEQQAESYLDHVEAYRLETDPARRKWIREIFLSYTVLMERLFQNLNISVCLAHERDFIDTATAQYAAEKTGSKIFYFSSGFFRGRTISVAPERILFTDYETWEQRIRSADHPEGSRLPPGKDFHRLPFQKGHRITIKRIPRLREYITRLVHELKPGEKNVVRLLRPRRNIIASLRHQMARQRARRLKPDVVSVRKPFVLVPLQGNEILGQVENPLGIRDMEHFCQIVIDAVTEFNRLHGADLLPVFKEHPLRPFVIGDSFIRANPNAVFLRKYDMDSLMDSASLIVTFNSLSGFEALQRGKPVVMLGPLFYRLKGLVQCPETLNDLPRAIKKAIDSSVDSGKLECLVSYLRDRYEVEANRKALDETSVYNIAARVLG